MPKKPNTSKTIDKRAVYIANGNSDLFFMSFNINLMEIKPETKATITPTTVGKTGRVTPDFAASAPSKIADAIIIGIESKKENSVASSLFVPSNSIVEIVIPLLDIPGRVATPCAMPHITEFPTQRGLSFGFVITVRVSIKAVIIKQNGKAAPSNTLGKNFLNNRAMTQVGTVAAIKYKVFF